MDADIHFGMERGKSLKKIFVSHPLTGNEKINRADAAVIVDDLQRMHTNIQFFNPLEIFHPFSGLCDEHVILAACMNLIKNCDVVLQCNGWQSSAGCRAEAAFAIVNDIPCIDVDDYLGGDTDERD